MQGLSRMIQLHTSRLKDVLMQHLCKKSWLPMLDMRSRFQSTPSGLVVMHTKGLENTTVAEILTGKGDEADELYSCSSHDTVFDAVKKMTEHNVGSLAVLKPGEEGLITGIVTERDYMKKIIVQGRSSKMTKVGEIMTNENKLITVSSETNILEAMKLMTENHIRHIPVIDKKLVGMISVVDVVRAVVEQQRQEATQLKDYISGKYY